MRHAQGRWPISECCGRHILRVQWVFGITTSIASSTVDFRAWISWSSTRNLSRVSWRTWWRSETTLVFPCSHYLFIHKWCLQCFLFVHFEWYLVIAWYRLTWTSCSTQSSFAVARTSMSRSRCAWSSTVVCNRDYTLAAWWIIPTLCNILNCSTKKVGIVIEVWRYCLLNSISTWESHISSRLNTMFHLEMVVVWSRT